MKTLAAELKSEREKRNMPLEKIAQETHISTRHLQSLEEGRYSDMPGGMYNRAFIKAYCEVLKLDYREILRMYEAELSPNSEKPAKIHSFAPQRRSFFWRNSIFAWSLLLIISATGLFFSRHYIASVFSPYFSQTPSALLRPETAAEPKSIPAETEESGPISGMNEAQPVVPGSSDPVAETVGPESRPPAYSDKTPALRIEFEVTEKCWISVDNDKGRVIRKIFEPGEAQTFDAAEYFFIVIGNAGGVHLRINGQPAKPLGKPGEVVKILINSQSLPDLINQTTG